MDDGWWTRVTCLILKCYRGRSVQFGSTRFIHWIDRMKEISIEASINAIRLIGDVLKIAFIICITFGMMLQIVLQWSLSMCEIWANWSESIPLKRTMSTKLFTSDRLDYAFVIQQIQVQWMRLLCTIVSSRHRFTHFHGNALLCIHYVDPSDAGTSGVSTLNREFAWNAICKLIGKQKKIIPRINVRMNRQLENERNLSKLYTLKQKMNVQTFLLCIETENRQTRNSGGMNKKTK